MLGNLKNRISQHSLTYLSKRFFADFSHLKQLPADPILGLVDAFNKDPSKEKISLSAGTYKDDNNKPYILKSIRKAQEIHFNSKMDNEYCPIEGITSFIDKSIKIAYSENDSNIKSGKITGIQSLSGTGALYLGFKFLSEHYPITKNIYIPDPSWPNHAGVAVLSGLTPKKYRYFDINTLKLNINGLLEDLDKAENGSIVVLHACAHNPTGLDPSHSQWEDILKVVQKKNHIPFFDSAYQGFATGDLDKDAWSMRRFSEAGLKCFLAQSFAKNFGLYGQRVGCLSMMTNSVEESKICLSHLKLIARRNYSNPPKYGAQLIDIVLSDKGLFNEWKEDLVLMSGRINEMRIALHKNLNDLGSKRNWDHIKEQIGMFAYTGLNKEQVLKLRNEKHLYFTDDGRISISGLNSNNVRRVAECFHEVTK